MPVRGFCAEMMFGPFVVDPTIPTVILLNGEIDLRSALEFRKALKAAPTASLLALNSRGGNVQIGLLIAEEVFERGLNTYVPPQSVCASACSFIFLAGRSRTAVGQLGVHQISSDVQDNAYTQLNLADVIEALTKYGTAPEILALMLKTPSDQMHFFSYDEILRFGLNRTIAPLNGQPSADLTPRPKVSPSSIDNLLKALRGE
jgi:hypothetical protein